MGRRAAHAGEEERSEELGLGWPRRERGGEERLGWPRLLGWAAYFLLFLF
jgi:hypothetical protein